MKKIKKIVLYLMNQKGYTVLNDLLDTYGATSVEYVVSSKDENIEKDYFEEINQLCKSHEIDLYSKNDNLPEFKGYKFAVGWRWLISDISNLIVLHDSLLPKYRGFSPLVNMLINGEKEIGVTALFASSNYDEGEIIHQRKVPITYPIKINEAIIMLSKLYSEITLSIINNLIKDEMLLSSPQNNSEATYSLWRDEKDYLINWSEDAKVIKRTIDALSFPFNGAKTYLNGDVVSIFDAEERKDIVIENRTVGKVIFIEDGFPVVVCGIGLLKITSAFNLNNNNSILPIKKFRSRFEGDFNL